MQSTNNNRDSLFLCYVITVIVKLILLGIFTSEYSISLFQPFVDVFTKSLGNPWQYYVDHGLNLDSFPYQPLMLYILACFHGISNLLGIDNRYAANFIIKLPLLLSDLMILMVFLKLNIGSRYKIFIFYFLNPIIFFATYIHAQLDIIPTAFLMASLLPLLKRNVILSAILFGLALSTKTHIFLAAPLLILYLYKTEGIKSALRFSIISLGLFMLFILPYINGGAYWHMVMQNSKQAMIFDSSYAISSNKIYLPLFAMFVVFMHFFNQHKINNDLLYFYLGILFAIVIFFVSSSPAWYVWMIPFVSVYFIKSHSSKKSALLYIAISGAYLVYFVFFHRGDYKDIILLGNVVDLKFNTEKLSNISFTVLEACVAATIYTFYKYGVKSNTVYKKMVNTTIGIGGDSGVGKTSLLNDITLLLGRKLLKLEGDGEHKWERGNLNWNHYTHLNPKANYIHSQANAINDLKHNKTIKRSDYDHATGKFTPPVDVVPRDFITLSGLHPFYLPAMRKIIDLKIFLDTDESLRRHWKLVRDTVKRGYSPDKVLEAIDKRVDDAEKYILPQKKFADIIIRYYPLIEFPIGDTEVIPELGVRITFDANIHIEEVLLELKSDLDWDYNNDLNTQYIDVRQEPDVSFKELALKRIPNLNELVDDEHAWLTGYRGLVQFIVLLALSETMRGADSYD